jgi:hypothetical protein
LYSTDIIALNPGKTPPMLSTTLILIALYVSGVIFFLFRLLNNIFYLARKSRISDKINFKGYRIILLDERTDPCCFFRNIYLNRNDFLKGKIDRELLDHELEHIKQYHTIDIILIELLKIFYWFNPVNVLYDRAIRINHEYLADNGVIRYLSDIESYYHKLLGFIAQSVGLSLTSGSRHSYTKQRLSMMMKSGSERFINSTKIILTLFMGLVVFMFLSFKEISKPSLILGDLSTGNEATQNVVKGIVMTEDGIVFYGATVKTTTINNDIIETITEFDGRFAI